MNELNGLIGIIKPSGLYSTKVLGRVKFILREQARKEAGENKPKKIPKVGHFGTLDENATGILVVALGKATKLNNKFSEKRKVYESTFAFGIETDTLDPLGKTTREEKTSITKKQLEEAMKKFVGKLNQLPPKYSANKINGERAYDLAREGKEVELKLKPVEVFSFVLLSLDEKNQEAKVRIECSTGTYVRSLARDVANALNTVAIAKTINRLASGDFNYSNSIAFEGLTYESIVNACGNTLHFSLCKEK